MGRKKEILQLVEWYESKNKAMNTKIENTEQRVLKQVVLEIKLNIWGAIYNEERGLSTVERASIVFTNYWKFVIFQRVFRGSVWIDWMPETKIWFLLTLVELKCTFLFLLQVTATKVEIDAWKSVQLRLLQTVELSFSAVATGSQFSGHKSEHIHVSWMQVKAT